MEWFSKGKASKNNLKTIDVPRWPAPFDDPRWLTLLGLTKEEFIEYLHHLGVNYYDNLSQPQTHNQKQ